jgi:hypothetical protein
MRSFSAAVSIKAPKERIWQILLDTQSYPEWNPLVERLEGIIRQGERLKIVPRGTSARTFHVVVESLVAPNKMVWRGSFPLNALVGTRTFILRSVKDGSVEFEMREVFSGWLARWMRKLVPDMQGGFEQFAVALKRRAEAGHAP